MAVSASVTAWHLLSGERPELTSLFLSSPITPRASGGRLPISSVPRTRLGDGMGGLNSCNLESAKSVLRSIESLETVIDEGFGGRGTNCHECLCYDEVFCCSVIPSSSPSGPAGRNCCSTVSTLTLNPNVLATSLFASPSSRSLVTAASNRATMGPSSPRARKPSLAWIHRCGCGVSGVGNEKCLPEQEE